MYNICWVVVSVIGSGMWDILISKDYLLYKTKKFDILQIDNSLIKIVDNEIWENIYNKWNNMNLIYLI